MLPELVQLLRARRSTKPRLRLNEQIARMHTLGRQVATQVAIESGSDSGEDSNSDSGLSFDFGPGVVLARNSGQHSTPRFYKVVATDQTTNTFTIKYCKNLSPQGACPAGSGSPGAGHGWAYAYYPEVSSGVYYGMVGEALTLQADQVTNCDVTNEPLYGCPASDLDCSTPNEIAFTAIILWTMTVTFS